MGPAPHALFTASTHRTLVPLHYCSRRRSWPVPLTAGESKPQNGGKDRRPDVHSVCCNVLFPCPSFHYATPDFTEATMHLTDGVGIVHALQIVNLHQLHTTDRPLKSKITTHHIKRKLIQFNICNANCIPQGHSWIFSVFQEADQVKS